MILRVCKDRHLVEREEDVGGPRLHAPRGRQLLPQPEVRGNGLAVPGLCPPSEGGPRPPQPVPGLCGPAPGLDLASCIRMTTLWSSSARSWPGERDMVGTDVV